MFKRGEYRQRRILVDPIDHAFGRDQSFKGVLPKVMM